MEVSLKILNSGITLKTFTHVDITCIHVASKFFYHGILQGNDRNGHFPLITLL